MLFWIAAIDVSDLYSLLCISITKCFTLKDTEWTSYMQMASVSFYVNGQLHCVVVLHLLAEILRDNSLLIILNNNGDLFYPCKLTQMLRGIIMFY